MGAFMRRLTDFETAGASLRATLDTGERKTGLLIVSGGREIRIGAHRGMAMLAARIAAQGFPVFRFDRRGIGDSTGEDGGFLSSAEDIAAAAACFRHEAQIERLIGFGNCDAATALALFHDRAGVDALVLANPWLIKQDDDLPPPAAIRARYAERVRDPAAWARLARGKINIVKLLGGLRKISIAKTEGDPGLMPQIAEALDKSRAVITILLAERDNTARAFNDVWQSHAFDTLRDTVAIRRSDTASHSFAGEAADWLFREIMAVLER